MQTRRAEWPTGVGEMARRIRAYDWSSSSLDAIETWPQSLRTVVDLLLASGHAMMLAWGPDRTLLYNDAYAPMLGGFHPRALGLPFRQAWPDIWADVESLVERVFAGETVRCEALPLVTQRHGYAEDTWWNFSYSPVRDESGAIAGLLNVTVDATPKMRAERAERERDEALARFQVEAKRHEFLLTLSDALRPLADAGEIQTTTARLLGSYLGVDRAMYAEVEGEPGAERGTIRAQYVRPASGGELAVPPFPERFTFRPFGAHTMAGRYRGEILQVADVQADPGFDWQERAAWAAAGVRAAIVAPLAKGGRLVAEFGVHCTAPRSWTDAEVWLVREVGERTWAAAERARAEKELRESEERLRLALDAAEMGSFAWYPDEDRAETDARLLALFGLPPHGTITHASAISELVHPEDRARDEAAVLQALDPNGDGHFHDEFRVVESDGTERWLATTGRVGFAGNPRRAVRLSGVAVDITERKRTEEALRASEERQAFLLALGDSMRAQPSAHGVIAAAGRLLGERLNASRIMFAEFDHERAIANIFHGWFADGAAPFPAVMRLEEYEGPILEDLRAGRTVRIDNAGDASLQRPDLAAIVQVGVLALLSVPLYVGGQLLVNLSVHQQVARHWTDDEVALVREVAERLWADVVRTRTEQALRESEEQFRRAVEEAPIPVIMHAEDGQVLQISRTWTELTGFQPEDIPTFEAWLNPAYGAGADAVRSHVHELFTGNRRSVDFEFPIRTRTGEQRHWSFSASSPGTLRDGRRFIVGMAVDITERVRAEKKLRESEERLRQFGEASQDILWIRDAATLQWTYLTPAFEAIYGLSREAALTGDNVRSWLDLILPEDRVTANDAMSRVRAGEHVTFDYRVRRPSDGAIRWVRNTDFPITNAAGEITLFGGIGHDFTGLRETELRLQTLIEGIPQLVWRAVGDGQWTWASPQWTEYTGQTEADSRGGGWLKALHPDDRTAAQHAWAHTGGTGGFEVEYRLCQRDTQEYRWFQTSATPVRGQTGEVLEWLGTSTDIHELRELQERQKVLVAELQHRTRNLMGVVRSVAHKTASSSADLDDFGERFGDRLEALARVQGLLSRLNEHDRVTFDELIATEVSALDGSGERVALSGPTGIRLRSSAVQTLALALHELFTNALKYGALRQPSGLLAVHWSLEPADADGPPWLHIDWRETGVALPPPDSKPERRGHGRELIERALPYQLKARTHYELGPDGVHCTISLPVSQTTESNEFTDA